ncbi:MAG TPA: xanthine dehydrogenase family protein molybdopterin-binding subunit [Candidatus Eremiobacteraceae bacterium]|nr:xanthine dehydrogenase family protein molybdopterin-binding subunit [Candidatus Eremiobacteraceae bacterium]HXZ39583.1 xanthine dehydrogenase family protein molybdopterin-binding subunit [Terriglobales bacterium]
MASENNFSRRSFIATGSAAGAALVLGFYIRHERGLHEAEAQAFRPSAWIRISPDDTITVLVEIPEMGQGPRTVDTMMLADELEADVSKIRVEQAPVIPSTYKNLSTGGSGGTQDAWGYMRKVGAQAREMLIAAAAQQWQVAKQECRAENSTVIHGPSGRQLSYGALVGTASKLPVPKGEDIPLKQPKDYRLIGKAMARVDVPAKVNGSAAFGIDVRVPDMLFAVIARCPHFGGKLQSFDPSAARSTPGVRAVFEVPPIGFHPNFGVNLNVAGGVAVVADSTWAAMQGRKALKITWDKGPHAGESTESIRQKMLAGATAEPTVVWVNQGDAIGTLQKSKRKIEATYEMPFQAHATMEPMNTTVHVHRGGIEIWSPTQIGDIFQREVAALAGIRPEKATVHMMYCGGSFGRRYQWDYVAEAWQIAKEVKRPVQLLWTREDDMQHDFYRPYSFHRLAGALDDQGNILTWSHRIVSTPIRPVFDRPEELTPEHIASQERGSADVLPYGARNFRVDFFPVESAVPRAWWRSVSDSFNGVAVECFVDELAHAAHKDPYEFRLHLVREDRKVAPAHKTDDPALDTRRFREVLKLAAQKSSWGKPMPAGYGRGIACRYTFGSYIAHVAEVSVDNDGNVQVHRVVCAVDPGIAVNPDGIRAMVEGGTNFALTPVLQGEITIKDASVEQSNFDGYQVLRMNYAPEIEVHVVPSGAEMGGMGETAVSGTAPAVANAVFAATGKRVRRLPIDPAFLAGNMGKPAALTKMKI